jgi:hypothetical protein
VGEVVEGSQIRSGGRWKRVFVVGRVVVGILRLLPCEGEKAEIGGHFERTF